MRLSWFFVASIAFHAALALVGWFPAESFHSEIAPVRLYFEADESPSPNERPSAATGSLPRQMRQVGTTRLPYRQAIAARAPDADGVRQTIHAPSHSLEAARRETFALDAAATEPAPPSVVSNADNNGTEAAGLALLTRGATIEKSDGQFQSLSAAFSRAEYAHSPKPEYPERAKREGWQGTVLLEVVIDAEGNPEKVAIDRSSGFVVLDRAAREAVKRWRFKPALMGNRQVTSTARIPIIFRLEADD